jgi:hypothetical protein
MYGLEWNSGDRYCVGDHHARLLGLEAFAGLFGAAFFGAVKLKTLCNRPYLLSSYNPNLNASAIGIMNKEHCYENAARVSGVS